MPCQKYHVVLRQGGAFGAGSYERSVIREEYTFKRKFPASGKPDQTEVIVVPIMNVARISHITENDSE